MDKRNIVKQGYGDLFDLNTRSLDFHTKYVSAKEACELVRVNIPRQSRGL
jgi:hypothetical protein